MPHLKTDDNVNLYYEEAGEGTPIIFVHEFAGDYRSWEPQMRHFSRRYRAITYNARGYSPSDIPSDPNDYSQKRACDDIRAVMDALQIEEAHIVGLPWEASRRCILVLIIRKKHCHLWLEDVDMVQSQIKEKSFKVKHLPLLKK